MRRAEPSRTPKPVSTHPPPSPLHADRDGLAREARCSVPLDGVLSSSMGPRSAHRSTLPGWPGWPGCFSCRSLDCCGTSAEQRDMKVAMRHHYRSEAGCVHARPQGAHVWWSGRCIHVRCATSKCQEALFMSFARSLLGGGESTTSAVLGPGGPASPTRHQNGLLPMSRLPFSRRRDVEHAGIEVGRGGMPAWIH